MSDSDPPPPFYGKPVPPDSILGILWKQRPRQADGTTLPFKQQLIRMLEDLRPEERRVMKERLNNDVEATLAQLKREVQS